MHQDQLTFALNTLPDFFSIEKVDGTIDEIEVFNYRLTEEEIRAKYLVSFDGDSLPDIWEYNFYDGRTDIASDETANGDNDAYTVGEEALLGLSPFTDDTDGDGLLDESEINHYKTNPLHADTDGDLLTDGEEINFGSDPRLIDSDQDSLDDYLENLISTQIDGADNIEVVETIPSFESLNENGLWFRDGDTMLAVSEYATASFASQFLILVSSDSSECAPRCAGS